MKREKQWDPLNSRQEDSAGNIFSLNNEKSRMIEHFMAQVKTEDMLNLAFMKPFQVALRTHRTDKSVPSDSLPRGLMIAQKQSINDNKYSLKRLEAIDATHLEQLREKKMDNYISLLKKPEVKDELSAYHASRMISHVGQEKDLGEPSQMKAKDPKHNGMEIGICVSVHNQSKKTLKNTLKGVANNIDEIIRSGVSPDDIFVVVVIDGVRNVDKSLFEYFEQFERESQIFLQEDEELTIRKKYEHQLYHNEVEKDEPLNYSKFLFKQDEFQERIDCKFVNIRKKYDEVLRIKGSIQNIKKENAKDNENLKVIVNRLADKQKAIMKKINKGKGGNSIVISEESIMKELANSEEQCNQYVNTRQDLAYVSVYRLPTTSLSEECKLKADALNEGQNKEMEEQLDSQRLMNESGEKKSLNETLNDRQNGKIGQKLLYVNLFFCIKYKETGKLNSHNWFINGFCQQLNPKFFFLIDVGVRPYPDAIYKMYRQMKVNPNVGATCGYLRLIEELVQDEETVKDDDVDCLTGCLRLFFDIQRSQQIETHHQYIMEYSFEALFRFIHVVPSFFSGYNMYALRPPGKKADDLLKEYFRTVDQKIVSNKIVPSEFTAGGLLARVLLPRTLWKRMYRVDPDSEEQLLANENTYQAQNRILCLGIHKNNKDIAFMPNVYAQVEPYKRISDLMEHKKLDINGGVFSFEKVENEFEHTEKKRQNFMVRFQLVYLSFLKLMTFLAPAFLLFAIQFAMQIVQEEFLAGLFATESQSGVGAVLYRTFTNLVVFIYAMAIFAIMFFSLHLSAKEQKFVYYAHLSSTILGFFTFLAFVVFIVHMILNIVQKDKSYLQSAYVNQLATFMDRQTATAVADILNFLLYICIVVMLLPSISYSIIFGKFAILWETFVGFPAYLFYVPTEFCVMPIYAKCRLDDVYGQNSAGAKNQKLRESWKIVKMTDVAKYLFWNIAIGITLLLLHGILLVKFFLLLIMIGLFILVTLIKWVPGFIFLLRYRFKKRKYPIEQQTEEREANISEMKLRIFDTIKSFEEDFTISIKDSFEEAAIIAQNKDIEKQLKKEAQDKKRAQQQQQKAQEAQKASLGNDRGGSIAFNNLVGLNQPKFTAKVQTIRQSSAVRPSYYPFAEGVAKKPPPANAQASAGMPLEMVLLKNQMTKEATVNADIKQDEQKLKKMDNFRSTIKPLGF